MFPPNNFQMSNSRTRIVMTAPNIRSEFYDRIAVVTGAGSGISRAIAVPVYSLSDRAGYGTGDVPVVDGGLGFGKAIYTDLVKGA